MSSRNHHYHVGNGRVHNHRHHHEWRWFRLCAILAIAITLGRNWAELVSLVRQYGILDHEFVTEQSSLGVIADGPLIQEGEADATSFTAANDAEGPLKQEGQSTRETIDLNLFELTTKEKKDPKLLEQEKYCQQNCYPDAQLVEKSLEQIVATADSGLSKQQEGTPTREKAAICTIVKDEEYYIQEWLQYHLALGFDDIYVFDDGKGTGKTPLFQSNERVHILPISAGLTSGRKCGKQHIIGNTCVELIRRRQRDYNYITTWVAMWDVDEFLVFHETNKSNNSGSTGGPAPPYETVQDFMRDLCLSHYCGSVGIRWINFGTSNQTYYSAKPVMQRFLYRDEEPDYITKTIFRLKDFSCTSNAHFAHLRRGDLSLEEDRLAPPFEYDTLRRIHPGGPIMAEDDEDAKHSPAFIHHYTKSLEEWYVRRCISGDVNAKENIRCNGIYPGAGSVYDDTAARSYQRLVENAPDTAPNRAFVPIQKVPDWAHHDIKKFMIKTQTDTVAKALHLRSSPPPRRPKEDQSSSIPLEQGVLGDLLGPIDVYRFMPKELPNPPEAVPINLTGYDTLKQAAITAGGISFPSFQKVRQYCISQIRNMQNQRLEQILSPLAGETNAIGSIAALHVDPAYHNNVGDSLLTVGTLSALARMGISEIKQCHYWQAINRVPDCESMIPDANLFKDHANRNKLAVWQPGGNWGDLWVNAHARRIVSFETLLANGYSVIGFPQSLVYRDAERGKREAAQIKDHISKGLNMSLDSEEGGGLAKSRVTFSWREKKSHSYALKLYPFVNNIILPDAAFQLGPFIGTEGIKEAQKVDVVLFMRKDVESVIAKYREDTSFITRTLRKFSDRDLSYKIVDWPDRLELFGTNMSHVFARDAIQLVSMGKVIVADRLHATILAYLSGAPVVYLDQLTGKISKSLGVAFDAWEGCQDETAGRWARATDFPQALEMAAKLVSEWTP